MTKLSVNVNKIATLRNTRDIDIPSVIQAAQTCIDAGAHGITVHPRPDERHIRESDAYEIADLVTAVEYNIEGNPFPRWMDIVRKVKPTQCTLVPDDPSQSTSDHGWDLGKRETVDKLIPLIAELKEQGSRVSIFMDPVPALMAKAKATGTDRVELYTEPYATAHREGRVDDVFSQYAEAAEAAQEQGLGINAGHDLSLDNLAKFLTIPGILEVSIGHALIGDAVFMGLANAVKAYLKIVSAGG